MPELPGRPDLDQLRRQARDLLRAAAKGEPHAVSRLRAVSGRTRLSSAQLAVAREYGFASWPALKAEIERRRSTEFAPGSMHPDGGPGNSHMLGDRWSFGGAAPIETTDGVLHPELLLIGRGCAILEASLAHPTQTAGQPAAEPEPRPPAGRMYRWQPPRFDDIIVSDDRGTRYALRLKGMSDHRSESGAAATPSPVSVLVEPVPEPGAAWFELRHPSGSSTRLLPSPQAAVRVSEATAAPASAAESELDEWARWLIATKLTSPSADLAPEGSRLLTRAAEMREAGQLDASSELPSKLARLLAALNEEQPAADLPLAWSRMLGAANQADGPRHHVDIRSTVPALGGVVTRLDSLVSGTETWRLFLQAVPGWFVHSADGRSKWTPVSIFAEDDLGGGYVSQFGGSSRSGDSAEEVILTFLPRLDPLSRRLKLTLRGGGQEVFAVVDLRAASPK